MIKILYAFCHIIKHVLVLFDSFAYFLSVQLNGRFGQALTLVDINADGYNDLVVSAPSEGSEELTYNVSMNIIMAKFDNFSQYGNSTKYRFRNSFGIYECSLYIEK